MILGDYNIVGINLVILSTVITHNFNHSVLTSMFLTYHSFTSVEQVAKQY